jgi:hypothetical protein
MAALLVKSAQNIFKNKKATIFKNKKATIFKNKM